MADPFEHFEVVERHVIESILLGNDGKEALVGCGRKPSGTGFPS
jgi:hypothetical protein